MSAAVALGRLFSPASAPKPKRAKTAASRPVARRGTGRPAAERPTPGSFIDGKVAGVGIPLSYKLYTPVGSPRRRLPLVVMLHGCTQTAADFAAGTRMNALADELGFIVLYPEQSRGANLARCWNWHRPGDQKRGTGEPAAIAALTRQIQALCHADPRRTYVAGISAGGVAAAILGQAYPDLYAAIGIHSGLSHERVGTVNEALAAMRDGARPAQPSPSAAKKPVPTILFHGDQDKTVNPANTAAFLERAQRAPGAALAERIEQGTSSGGRHYTRRLYRTAGSRVVLESWTVHGGAHAWSGGSRAGSYTDPAGPDASRATMRFFLDCRQPARPAHAAG